MDTSYVFSSLSTILDYVKQGHTALAIQQIEHTLVNLDVNDPILPRGQVTIPLISYLTREEIADMGYDVSALTYTDLQDIAREIGYNDTMYEEFMLARQNAVSKLFPILPRNAKYEYEEES